MMKNETNRVKIYFNAKHELIGAVEENFKPLDIKCIRKMTMTVDSFLEIYSQHGCP